MTHKMMTDVINLTLVTLQRFFWAEFMLPTEKSHCQMKIIDFQQEGNVRLNSEEKFIICLYFLSFFWFVLLLIQSPLKCD